MGPPTNLDVVEQVQQALAVAQQAHQHVGMRPNVVRATVWVVELPHVEFQHWNWAKSVLPLEVLGAVARLLAGTGCGGLPQTAQPPTQKQTKEKRHTLGTRKHSRITPTTLFRSSWLSSLNPKTPNVPISFSTHPPIYPFCFSKSLEPLSRLTSTKLRRTQPLQGNCPHGRGFAHSGIGSLSVGSRGTYELANGAS